MPLTAGQTFSFYEILAPLGAGGMGEVWRARDTRLDREVAIKVLPDALRDDSERRARFLREARAVAHLTHPHIAQILDIGEAEGLDFIALELVEGRTLLDVLGERRFELTELVELALPLADALAYAHERGILHRDVKAGNVMITSRGHAKLLDFGLAKVLSGDGDEPRARTTTLTMQGAIFGTPAAMSPEQALGRTLDARSDVFSFGSLLYEMACGRTAFVGDTAMEIIDHVVNRDPIALGRVRPELPQDFVGIVDKALRKDPGERYQTMSDLAADLRHFKRTTDSGLVPPGSASSRTPVLAVALAAAVVVAAGAWWAMRGGDPTTGATGEGGGRASSSPTTPGARDAAPLIAVIGFENLADPSDANALGRMLTSLVATDLAEHGGMRVVSTAKVLASLEALKPGAGARFESALASRAAADTGASLMLVGQILRGGTGVLLTAELVDIATGETRRSLREQVDSEAEVFALAGGLAESVRLALGVAKEEVDFELSRALTESPEAYREFNAGELAMQHREFEEARLHFQRAIARDPGFALAWIRMGLVDDWLDMPNSAVNYERALQNADRLSERWLAICKAAAARARNNHDEAYAAILPLIEGGVDIPEAYNEYGETLTHALRYLDQDGARRAFARAYELDPTFELVLYHLIHQTLGVGDIERARELAERASFETFAIEIAEGRYDEVVAQAVADLAADESTDFEGYIFAARMTGDEAKFNRALAAWESNEPTRAHWQEAHGAMWDLDHGRFEQALQRARRAIEFSVDSFARGWNELVLLYLLEILGEDDQLIEAARAMLEQEPYDFEARFWMGGAVLRSRGVDEAKGVLDEARTMLAQSKNAFGPSLLDGLEALIFVARGELERAEEIVERIRARPAGSRMPEIENHVVARVAEASGDLARAAAAWRELSAPTFAAWLDTRLCVTRPTYEVGRLEHERGNVEEARAYLTRFLERWGNADRELPSIADARERLARIEAQ